MNSWGMEWNLDAEQRRQLREFMTRLPQKKASHVILDDLETESGAELMLKRMFRQMRPPEDRWVQGRQRTALACITMPPEPGEMAEAARRVVHVQRLFRPVFPKPLPRQFFAPCSGA